MTQDYQIFQAGDVTLQSGQVFPSLQITYKTYGTLNATKDNVIVFPTSFSAQHTDLEWLICENGPFDPAKWFVVIPNLFGNGLSSSPSNSTPAVSLADYPLITYHDAIDAQYRLVTEHLGVRRIALVYGWSMGGMQSYHWAALYPEIIDRVAVVCGNAACSPYNKVFLEGVRAALTSDSAFRDGYFHERPQHGYRTMGRVYAGWALSHAFYRDSVWREAGFDSLEDYLVGAWDSNFARRDANDLLAQLNTWQHGDISANSRFNGDMRTALGAITSHILLMPGETDEYFQVDDNRRELPYLINARSAELRPIPSVWGHRAGNPQTIPRDRAWLEAAIKGFLAKAPKRPTRA